MEIILFPLRHMAKGSEAEKPPAGAYGRLRAASGEQYVMNLAIKGNWSTETEGSLDLWRALVVI